MVKAEQKVIEVRAEETAYIKAQTIACCMVFDQGTLFERSCKGEMPIGETTLYQITEQWSQGYEEGSYDTGCKIKCTCCGNVLYLSESDWLENIKRYFKQCIRLHRNDEIK